MSLLFACVELDGDLVDVRVDGAKVIEIGRSLSPSGRVLEGRGGSLLPGLHDHHLHLFALAAALQSVDCSRSLDGLATATPRNGWVRGFGVADSPSRHELDDVRRDVPVRVQHRGGAMWVLNSAALQEVGPVLDNSVDVERDSSGQPTGRLFRYDARLRDALPSTPPELGVVVEQLHRYGITGVTDATPDLTPESVATLLDVAGLNVTLLGGTEGPRKLLLRDHDLPTYADLLATVEETRAAGRPVAVHCVTRESLVLTLAILREVGSVPGDRIEHAAVVPPVLTAELRDLGLAVVTQPSFLRMRGDDYLREVDPIDQPWLYPYASLVEAGVRVTASSDAPYGDLDPWRGMHDASSRRSASGAVLGPGERVPFEVALAGYLSPPLDPGGQPRRVTVGSPADLCLLTGRPGAADTRVRAVTVRGTLDELPSQSHDASASSAS